MRKNHTAQTNIFDCYAQHEFAFFLSNLSNLLDSHAGLILSELENDFRHATLNDTGRDGLSIDSIFRCMLLKQITRVSYERLAFHLADSGSYRTFARLSKDCFPRRSTLSENIRRIQPQTLQRILNKLNINAFHQGLLKTDKLRMDSTVVNSNIAPPSDSRLLNDGIRVLSRLFAKSQLINGVKLRLTDYRKPSRSLAARIFYAKKAMKDVLYVDHLTLARHVIRQSERAISQVQESDNQTLAQLNWIAQVEHYRGLLERVIDQTERRVIRGEQVPATEKLYSLFETHTDIIIKGRRDIEYGHKVNLATDKNGLITVFRIEEGNPNDSSRFIPVLTEYQALYGCVPKTSIADGGYGSLENILAGKDLGIKQVAFHKKKGLKVSDMGIQQRTLEKLKDFRAGIEGNISELKRAFGAGKAMWKGESGFKSFALASVISYNLTKWVRMSSG